MSSSPTLNYKNALSSNFFRILPVLESVSLRRSLPPVCWGQISNNRAQIFDNTHQPQKFFYKINLWTMHGKRYLSNSVATLRLREILKSPRYHTTDCSPCLRTVHLTYISPILWSILPSTWATKGSTCGTWTWKES